MKFGRQTAKSQIPCVAKPWWPNGQMDCTARGHTRTHHLWQASQLSRLTLRPVLREPFAKWIALRTDTHSTNATPAGLANSQSGRTGYICIDNGLHCATTHTEQEGRKEVCKWSVVRRVCEKWGHRPRSQGPAFVAWSPGPAPTGLAGASPHFSQTVTTDAAGEIVAGPRRGIGGQERFHPSARAGPRSSSDRRGSNRGKRGWWS